MQKRDTRELLEVVMNYDRIRIPNLTQPKLFTSDIGVYAFYNMRMAGRKLTKFGFTSCHTPYSQLVVSNSLHSVIPLLRVLKVARCDDDAISYDRLHMRFTNVYSLPNLT
jgi:hypothetical protein